MTNFARLPARVLTPLARLRFISSVGIALGIALTTLTTHAQPAAENIAAARVLGQEGLELANAGKCPEAIEKLERAEALFHAPTILGPLGECQVQVGRLVLGSENLNRVAREQLAPNAPQAFRDAQERARHVLQQTLPRIPRLIVRVEPAEAKPQVTIGGVVLPPALIGVERPTDPGTYDILVTARGFAPSMGTVTLQEGGHEEVVIQLHPAVATEPDAQAQPAAAAPVTESAAPPSAPPERRSSASNIPAYALFGVAGLGVVVGSVTGILVLDKKSELHCTDNVCPASEQTDYDAAMRLASVSTISFAVAGAAALGGGILLYTNSRSHKSAQRVSHGISTEARLSLRGIEVSGSF